MTPEQEIEAKQILKKGRKLDAIRYIHQTSGLSYTDCKALCDKWEGSVVPVLLTEEVARKIWDGATIRRDQEYSKMGSSGLIIAPDFDTFYKQLIDGK